MITNAPVPFLKTVFTLFLRRKEDSLRMRSWKYRKQHRHFLYSKSAWAFHALCESYYEDQKRPIRLFIPALFCKESISILDPDKFPITFYNLTDDLSPNWEEVKQNAATHNPDLFILTHYFGNIVSLKETSQFCKNHNSIFVEDCAHLALPGPQVGKYSHYQFYSLYKHFPIPNGSVLIDARGNLPIQQETPSTKKEIKWLTKRVLQNILPFTAKPHVNTFYKTFPTQLPRKNISQTSLNLLQSILDEKDLESYRESSSILSLWHEVMLSIFNSSRVTLISSIQRPYLATFRIKNLSSDEINQMAKLNLPIFNWPDLPLEVYKNKNYPCTNSIKSELVCLPLNYRMNDCDFVSIFKTLPKKKTYHIATCDNAEGESVSHNMLQSFHYIKAKSKIERKTYQHLKIVNQGTTVAYFSVLIKKIGFVHYLRINRGPIFIKDISIREKLSVYKAIKYYLNDHYKGLLIWKPEEEPRLHNILRHAVNPIRLLKNNYTSGIVDLSCSEEKLKKNLTSTWRNQWKKSQEFDLSLKVSSSKPDYQLIREKYSESMNQKNFQGISLELLDELYSQNECDFLYYLVVLNDTVIAANIIYLNQNTATYLIGWNSAQGRSVYANNYLLWAITNSLKKKGILYFDLGGIDKTHTPQIAKFKEGLGSNLYSVTSDWFIPLI
jgi:hypothetical protein